MLWLTIDHSNPSKVLISSYLEIVDPAMVFCDIYFFFKMRNVNFTWNFEWVIASSIFGGDFPRTFAHKYHRGDLKDGRKNRKEEGIGDFLDFSKCFHFPFRICVDYLDYCYSPQSI